jgi:hypothetical protein
MSDVYVITGRYSDNSGFYLLGVYEDAREGNDRVQIAKAAQAAIDVRIWRMPLGSVNLVDVSASQANPQGDSK